MKGRYLSKSAVLIVASLQWFYSFGQTKVIDSLKNVLQNSKTDTNKVNTLNNLSKSLWLDDYNTEAGKYANEALALAGTLGFKEGITNSFQNLAAIYQLQSNYSEALKFYLASVKISEEIGDKKGIAASYNNMGMIYKLQGNNPEALKFYLASVKISEEIGDKRGIATSYNNIGIIYRLQGNNPEALRFHLAALKIKEKIRDKKGIALSNLDIGNVYWLQGNYSEALKYFLSTVKTAEEINDKRLISTSYNNLGVFYESQQNYPEALRYFLASLSIAEEVGDKSKIANCCNNIGVIYTDLGNYPEALKHLLVTVRIKKEIGEKSEIGGTYQGIGAIYQFQGNYSEALKYYLLAIEAEEEVGNKSGIAEVSIALGEINIFLKNHSQAQIYLDKGLSLSKQIGSKYLLKEAYKTLMRHDSATGNYRQALIHYKLYTDYKDSLFNKANSERINQLKEQYESEKKDKEIIKLEGEKQKLEDDKWLTALLIKAKEDSLNLVQTEKEKIRLDNERIQAINLYNLQQLTLLAKGKQLQQLKLEKNEADLLAQTAESEMRQSNYLAQKLETEKKSSELSLANNVSRLQSFELRTQKQLKNYLIAGLALILVLSFFVYRNYYTKQQLKLQTLRNKIASDLHDDVGSTLSSISIFSEMAKQQSKEVLPLLDTIGESSRKMLDAMGDIVWTINPENDQFEKIVLRMKSFAYELLGAKNIDFEFVADEDITKMKLPMDVRKNLYLIFKEATNNMVKYANADKAMFAIKGGKDNLTMLIQDNGRGFDMAKSSEGNGLKNMRRRANEIGAELHIESYPGNGTTIQLKVAV